MSIMNNIKSGFESAGCWIKNHAKPILIGVATVGGSLLAIGIAGALKSEDCDYYEEIDILSIEDAEPEVETTVELDVDSDEECCEE